jgi:hypothetical protein
MGKRQALAFGGNSSSEKYKNKDGKFMLPNKFSKDTMDRLKKEREEKNNDLS